MNNHGKGPMGGLGTGHELRDINARKIVIFGAVLVAVIALSLAVMKVTFDFFANREAANQPPPATLAAHAPDQLPPEPRLQQNPLHDLAELRASEAGLLTNYGWVDEKRGIVRIPVEEAMRRTVQQGLPHRDSAPAPAAIPAGGRP